MSTPRPVGAWRSACGVGLVAAGLLGLELSLMRHLLVASWYHFATLVIAICILGFGASGTVLTLRPPRPGSRPRRTAFRLALAGAMVLIIAWRLADLLPVSVRLLPVDPWRQLAWWSCTWMLLLLPFLLGAAAICLTLMTAGEDTGRVYAGNLIGSAAGATLVTVLLFHLPPAQLALPLALLVLGGGALLLPWDAGRWDRAALLAGLVLCCGLHVLMPARTPVDQHKDLPRVQQLERQGRATRLATWYSPRGQVDLYRSSTFHRIPFLGTAHSPPPLDLLLLDGQEVGSVLRIDEVSQAAFLDDTLMGWPHDLVPPEPRVLLLGETGGINLWLARWRGARAITVVQPHEAICNVLEARGHLPEGEVRVVATDPRAFLEHCREQFDLVEIVSLQGTATGGSGLAGLAQDHLITVEGMRRCLERLPPGGVLSISRGLQTPPRDNLRILATLVEALGADDPGDHVAQVRDYLAACTVASARPWSEAQLRRMREAMDRRRLTPIWVPGVPPERLNQPDAMPGPAGVVGCWYHHGAREILSPGRRAFLDRWAFEIGPATDDRPYFHDFFRWRSLGALRAALGAGWIGQVELGFPFALVSLLATTLVGAVLTLAPVSLLRRRGAGPGRAVTLVYFGAIGVGYMLLEMAFLGRLTHLMGDPVLAASACLAGFLVASGAGSWWAGRRPQRSPSALALCVAAITVLGALAWWTSPGLLRLGLGTAGRYGAGLACIIPPAVAMGWMLPSGLRRLDAGAPALIPWAWGINGFASAVATTLALVVAMTLGLSRVLLLALAAYLIAALVYPGLPGRGPDAAGAGATV